MSNVLDRSVASCKKSAIKTVEKHTAPNKIHSVRIDESLITFHRQLIDRRTFYKQKQLLLRIVQSFNEENCD